MIKKIIHISANVFKDLDSNQSTKKIWEELAVDFEEYHIMARSVDNRFHNYSDGKIYLHLVPNLFHSGSFMITSFYMIRLIKKYKIDGILAQCPILGGFTCSLISKFYDIPYMQEIHDTYYFDLNKSTKLKNKLLFIIFKFSLKNASKVRALNEMMMDLLKEINANLNVVVIENRVDLEVFRFKKENYELHNPIRITSIGTFVSRKGLKYSIKAIKELSEKYSVELMLIGGGEEKKIFQEMARGYKNIVFLDRVSQEELANILKDTDIYIQPSLREGMPRTILEAMAMQLPIISTNVSTIPGVIKNKKNGVLINPKSVGELSMAIQELILNKELREKLAKKAYIDVHENYEWKKVFNKYRNELKNIKV